MPMFFSPMITNAEKRSTMMTPVAKTVNKCGAQSRSSQGPTTRRLPHLWCDELASDLLWVMDV